jgi:hypothetical protein
MDPARENLLPSQNNKAFDTEKSPTAQFGWDKLDIAFDL